MSKNSEFVKFDNVDKSYDGKVLVVKGLQLDIAEGATCEGHTWKETNKE